MIMGMCKFPHNPAVYCLKANVSNVKKYTKSKNYKCRAEAKLIELFRPANTYSYNENLERNNFRKPTQVSVSKKEIVIYAQNCKDLEGKVFLTHLSCYDKESEFPDFTYLIHSSLKEKIEDPWEQVEVEINCAFMKEAKNG